MKLVHWPLMDWLIFGTARRALDGAAARIAACIMVSCSAIIIVLIKGLTVVFVYVNKTSRQTHTLFSAHQTMMNTKFLSKLS